MRSVPVLPFILAPLLLAACAHEPPPATPATPPAPPSAAPSPPAPPPPYGSSAALGGWIDAYVSPFGAHWGEAYAAQCYLAVADGGKVVFEKGYGKADREQGRAAGGDTRYRIGSITKQFTATAILQLEKKGLLKVTDPLLKYVPEYPAAGDKITLHHLLTHTSGIPSYTDDEALMKRRDQPATVADILATFRDKPLAFDPGTQFRYSNSNYYLLGVVIERVTGKHYEDYLQENVLRPAGMTRTSTVDAPDAPDTAVGYEVSPDEALVRAKPIDMSLPFAAGALRSTAHDMIAWDSALAADVVLDEASQARMLTPFKEGYAYGWSIHEMEGKRVAQHSGGIDGFSSYFARAPEAKLAVVALCNSSNFDAASIGVPALRMALSGKPIPPVEERVVVAMAPALLRSVPGEYTMSDESRKKLEGKIPAQVLASVLSMTFTAEGDRLRFKPVGQDAQRLFAGEGGVLFAKGIGIEVTVEPGDDASAPAKAVTLTQHGVAIRYMRAKPEKKKAAPPKGKKK